MARATGRSVKGVYMRPSSRTQPRALGVLLRQAPAPVVEGDDVATGGSQGLPCSCAGDVAGARTNRRADRLGVITDAVASLERAATVLRGEALAEEWGALDVKTGIDLYQEVRGFETRLIERALREAEGNQTRAARLLGLRKTTLHEKIKRYGINQAGEAAESNRIAS
jgi:DNA-binding protein Fis